MATILTKKSDTASSVPLVADLTNAAGGAELAVNTADKRLFTKTSGGTVVELGINPSSLTLPNGTANGIPYLNGSKVLTSGSALTFDGTNLKTTGYAKAGGFTVAAGGLSAFDAAAGGLYGYYSAGGILASYSDNSGTLAPLTFDGSYLAWRPAGSEKMRLDSSGNLGLGVTPSAWGAGIPTLQVGSIAALNSRSNQMALYSNSYFDGTNFRSIITGFGGRYRIDSGSGAHAWDTIPSVTAGSTQSITQAMTLNANGQLLIGATSSGSTDAQLLVSNGGANGLEISATAVSGQIRLLSYNRSTSAYAGAYYAALDHKFDTGGVERARIDSSGNLLVGRSSTGGYSQTGVQIEPSGYVQLHRGSTGNYIAFLYNPTSSTVGSISTNGTTTSYNTSSDYRLKENIQPMTGALAKVAALKPVTYTWKADGSAGEGFIAHELAEVCPAAVTGEKDGMRTEQYEISPAVPATFDEEGNELTPAVEAVMGERQVPAYQGIDVSFLVGTLTAAIQELKADFDAYKAAHP